MDNHSTDKSRRAFLKGVAAIPVLAIAAKAQAEMLSLDDPTAKALGYVEVSATEGQTCANCNLYQGGDTAGACAIFPGKDVAAAGWCRSWVAKP